MFTVECGMRVCLSPTDHLVGGEVAQCDPRGRAGELAFGLLTADDHVLVVKCRVAVAARHGLDTHGN